MDVKAIIDDGVVDAQEVKEMKAELYADGTIDRTEADQLFEVNDAVSGAANDPSWGQLFVDALTDHVLADDTSPGVLDEEEAMYLHTKIHGDGTVDENKRALVKNVIAKATSVPDWFANWANAL